MMMRDCLELGGSSAMQQGGPDTTLVTLLSIALQLVRCQQTFTLAAKV